VRIVDRQGNFMCGGAYISPIVVVSSANCMRPHLYAIQDLEVQPGFLIGSDDDVSTVDTFYTPPEFKNGKNFMDVAVLRLRVPIKGKMTEFIKLCETEINSGMQMISLGWGYASFTVMETSTEPITRLAPIIDMETCKSRWKKGKNIKLSKSIFCVQYPINDRKKCLYDPGCPLLYKDSLCGIVSEDASCLHPKCPAIYTNINEVRNFILQTDAEI
ncbi:hypothetical protein KR222_008814, partial [Zaprionus bogoriensis]